MLLFGDMLYMLVRYASPIGPMCLSLKVPDVNFIRPCGVVIFAMFYCRLDLCCGECYVGCLFEYFPISVFVLCDLCLTVLVNCLLNTFAICVGEVTVFSLKLIVLFLGCVGVLFANLCIVFQRVCVLCL